MQKGSTAVNIRLTMKVADFQSKFVLRVPACIPFGFQTETEHINNTLVGVVFVIPSFKLIKFHNVIIGV